MSKELTQEYDAFSLTTALKPAAASAASTAPDSSPPLASPTEASASQWGKMFNSLTKERKDEVISKAIQQVQESNYRGLRKGPLVAELRRGLTGVLPMSGSAKFFLMQAAFDCGGHFVFQTDRWHWPPYSPSVNWPTHHKWTVLKPDGSVVLEKPKDNSSACTVGVQSPWHPLKARAAYKKPELAKMVQVLVGEVPPKAKADELYAMLVGKLQPLGQP